MVEARPPSPTVVGEGRGVGRGARRIGRTPSPTVVLWVGPAEDVVAGGEAVTIVCSVVIIEPNCSTRCFISAVVICAAEAEADVSDGTRNSVALGPR